MSDDLVVILTFSLVTFLGGFIFGLVVKTEL